ncbi:MAG: hypothetical protein QXQ40_00775 [Candidatus Aenigmatarchaeota archaeon]
MVEKAKNEEIMLDAFTREAVLMIIEKFKKQDATLSDLKSRLAVLERKIDSLVVKGSLKPQTIDNILIERLKCLEEKVNKLENIVNTLKIPKMDRNILDELK